MSKKISLAWDNVHEGVQQLWQLSKESFQPDAVLALSGPSSVIAGLAMAAEHRFLPLFTVMLEEREGRGFAFEPTGYRSGETGKWRLHVPEAVFEDPQRRLLIFDDCRITGETSSTLIRMLTEAGFTRENLHLAVLVASDARPESPDAFPDSYWLLSSGAEILFPWGSWY